MILPKRDVVALTFAAFAAVAPLRASAETIHGALSKAYRNNAELNSARAGVRATREGVAIASSGWRPTITATASVDYAATRQISGSGVGTRLTTGGFGVQINQTLFDGFQTRYSVRAATSQVAAEDENLRNTEETILFNAASAYMDVIRDRQVARLTEKNLQFLDEQIRATQSRFEVGDATRTDLAQAEAAHSSAIAALSVARAQVKASEAVYRQIIGVEPGSLDTAPPLSKLIPSSLDAATAVATKEHPAILHSKHLVDVAANSTRATEGQMLPGVSASTGISRDFRNTVPPGASILPDGIFDTATVGATVTVPVYQGGRVSALLRQSKETLSQARINVEVSQDSVRAAVVSSWTQYTAACENVASTTKAIEAARLALDGVIEERQVGQRTTLDVLNAQNSVITAQISLAAARRDAVVASYAILSAIGRLSAERLGLSFPTER